MMTDESEQQLRAFYNEAVSALEKRNAENAQLRAERDAAVEAFDRLAADFTKAKEALTRIMRWSGSRFDATMIAHDALLGLGGAL